MSVHSYIIPWGSKQGEHVWRVLGGGVSQDSLKQLYSNSRLAFMVDASVNDTFGDPGNNPAEFSDFLAAVETAKSIPGACVYLYITPSRLALWMQDVYLVANPRDVFSDVFISLTAFGLECMDADDACHATECIVQYQNFGGLNRFANTYARTGDPKLYVTGFCPSEMAEAKDYVLTGTTRLWKLTQHSFSEMTPNDLQLMYLKEHI